MQVTLEMFFYTAILLLDDDDRGIKKNDGRRFGRVSLTSNYSHALSLLHEHLLSVLQANEEAITKNS